MAQLTNEQIHFLKKQKVSPSLLFDATGLSAEERKKTMTSLEKQFYYGGAVCKTGGHSLRTKSGHCIQCDTSKIAYQQRSSASGYVYLAHSKSTNLIKVGYTKSHPQDRGKFLRDEAYGGIKDWDIKKLVELEKDAGKVEFNIHNALEQYQRPHFYEKGKGSVVECREIFSCDLNIAVDAFTKLTGT
jgi:hypothetical protein